MLRGIPKITRQLFPHQKIFPSCGNVATTIKFSINLGKNSQGFKIFPLKKITTKYGWEAYFIGSTLDWYSTKFPT
jgi:hypothetical protein